MWKDMNYQELGENPNLPLPKEEMRQKGRETRKKAKELQKKL